MDVLEKVGRVVICRVPIKDIHTDVGRMARAEVERGHLMSTRLSNGCEALCPAEQFKYPHPL